MKTFKKIIGLLFVLTIAACANATRAPRDSQSNLSNPSNPLSKSVASAAATEKESTALSEGEIIYGYRCKGCHEPHTPGAASRKKLGNMDPADIVEALSIGKMKIMTPGMTMLEMRQVAVFLTGEALPAQGNYPALSPHH